MFAFQRFIGLTYLMALFFYAYAIIPECFEQDEKNNSEKVVLSLPVSRKDIVVSRYLLVFITIIIGNITFFTLNFIGKYLPFSYESISVNSPLFAFVVFYIVLFYSICFPVMFKVGKHKARGLIFVLFFATFFGLPTLINAITGSSNELLSRILSFAIRSSNMQITVILLLLTGLVCITSLLVSLLFYKQREF
jgi:ABC-type transport system involved in multi-copper enzyme maturation permease subunit